MTSLLKSIFGGGSIPRNPSFDDLSMGASRDGREGCLWSRVVNSCRISQVSLNCNTSPIFYQMSIMKSKPSCVLVKLANV
jgi:hypothetical protein